MNDPRDPRITQVGRVTQIYQMPQQQIRYENQAARETVSVMRSESNSTMDYDFKARGKYTSQILPKFNPMQTPRSSTQEFHFDQTDSNYCNTHTEIKEYILLENVDKYKIYETICKNCLSMYNYKRGSGSDYKAKLFDAVIMENKEKIIQIRNDKISLSTGSTDECLGRFRDTVFPVLDEFLFTAETFESDICAKISGGNARGEEIAKLKAFINAIELTPDGDPNVFGIGKNEALKHKYIKLALFLIRYTGTSNQTVSHKGMSESLKNHMVKLIQLRKIMILRITDWLRYLIGPFYDFIFNMEGVPVDEVFRKNLQIDYVSEEDLLKLKISYENELRKRDERIKFLEDENARLKKEIDNLQGSLVVMSENESALEDLRLKFKQLEAEWLRQKDQIAALNGEIQRLNGINSELLQQIENYKKEIAQTRLDCEQKMRQALDNMRNEYEKRLSDLTMNLNNLSVKYSELEKKYQMEVRQLTTERDGLNAKINMLNQRYDADCKSYREQIEALSKDLNNTKNTLNSKLVEISQLSNERDGLKIQLENLRNQISSQDNQIKNLINQINILTKERDDARNQLSITIQERDGLRNQFETLKGQIAGFEQTIKNYSNNITLLVKERDELRMQISILTQERDSLKSTIEGLRSQISSLEIQIKNLVNQITNLTKERDDARAQGASQGKEIDNLKGELSMITNIKISLEGRLTDLQKKYDDLSQLYSNLQKEYNIKVTIIANLENKINELNGIVSNTQEQLNLYMMTLKKYESEISELRKQNEDLRIRLLVIPERDAEIQRLKLAITSCREEWNKLSESYETLLADIKNQISINEALRGVIFELQNKIETHNQQVGGLDTAIRQQIEILTRQTLAKKNIEYNPNNETVRRSQNEMDALRTKIVRLETQKLTKSAVFTNVNMTIDESQPRGSLVARNNQLQMNLNNYGSNRSIYYENNNNTNNLNNINNNLNNINNNLNNQSYYNNNYRGTTYMDQGNNYAPGYTQYRPTTINTYDRNYGANVFSNYANFNNGNNNDLITVTGLRDEDIKDKHGLLNATIDVQEEYTSNNQNC